MRQNQPEHIVGLHSIAKGVMNQSKPIDDVRRNLAAEVLRSERKLSLRATGWSMLPTIWPGDVLAIDAASTQCISTGNVVLFLCGNRFVAHRVVAKSDDFLTATLQTQGDALCTADGPIDCHQLLGKVAFIQRNGKQIPCSPRLSLRDRAIAALIRRSQFVARAMARAYTILQNDLKKSPDRVANCQN